MMGLYEDPNLEKRRERNMTKIIWEFINIASLNIAYLFKNGQIIIFFFPFSHFHTNLSNLFPGFGEPEMNRYS